MNRAKGWRASRLIYRTPRIGRWIIAAPILATLLLAGCAIPSKITITTTSTPSPAVQPSSTPTPTASPQPTSTPPGTGSNTTSTVTPGYLGVDFQSFNEDGTQGCKLTTVLPNSPASSGGLTAGDVLQAATVQRTLQVGTAMGTPIPIRNCNDLTPALYQDGPGANVVFTFVHQVGILFLTSWQGGSATVTLGTPPCPPPITGQISGAGNRIPLQIELVGPSGSYQMNAILDTGGVNAFLLDGDLTRAGFTPVGSNSVGLAGWSGQENVYAIPASDLRVLDQGVYVPLATGTLTVDGAPPAAFQTGIGPLVGPDVLQQGAALVTSGSTWTLSPACP